MRYGQTHIELCVFSISNHNLSILVIHHRKFKRHTTLGENQIPIYVYMTIDGYDMFVVKCDNLIWLISEKGIRKICWLYQRRTTTCWSFMLWCKLISINIYIYIKRISSALVDFPHQFLVWKMCHHLENKRTTLKQSLQPPLVNHRPSMSNRKSSQGQAYKVRP